MPREKIITAIDIGSSKICAIVASVASGRISVIGNATVPSKGIDRGVVNDIDSAVEAIASCIEKVEKMSGHAVSKAVITVNGQHISSENSTGVVAVTDPQGEINAQDIMRVNEAAQAVTIPSNREVIHVIPRDYVVDSQGNIKNPEGMSGVRLEVEAHIIHASSTVLKNVIKCVRQVGVEVSDLIFTGLASGESVLTDTEKELGTVVVDIGGRTSSCVVFQNGSPVFSFVVPLGGKHITGDIAVGLRCSLDVAERIKYRLSSKEHETDLPEVLGADKDFKRGELYVGDIDAELNTVPRKFVEKLANDRISEIMSMVNAELNKANFGGKISAGAIITGGASETINMAEIAKLVFKAPVRIARPKGLTGLIDEIEGPAYSACVGAVLHKSAQNEEDSNFKGGGGKINAGIAKSMFSSIKKMFKAFLP